MRLWILLGLAIIAGVLWVTPAMAADVEPDSPIGPSADDAAFWNEAPPELPPEDQPEPIRPPSTIAEEKKAEKAAAAVPAGEKLAPEKIAPEIIAPEKTAEEKPRKLKQERPPMEEPPPVAPEPPPVVERRPEPSPSRPARRIARRSIAEEEDDYGAPSETVALSRRKKLPDSPLSWGLDLQFVPARFPSLVLDGTGGTSSQRAMGLHLGLEYLLFQGFGKLAVGGGATVVNLSNAATSSGSSANLWVYAVDGSLAYRLDFIPHQAAVPFAKVGFGYGYSDNATSRGGATGVLLGGGLELGLYHLSKKDSKLLDRSYGINDVYLTLEYVKSQIGSGGTVDLSGDQIRAGLRFEI